MKISFLIPSLGGGGAERQLVLLARGLAQSGHKVSIHLFYSDSLYKDVLQAAGVRVNNLGKSGRWDTFNFLLKTKRALASDRPDVVHSYMGSANIVSGLLKTWIRPGKVVWGIRASALDARDYGLLHRASSYLESLCSRRSDLIICNSAAGRNDALRRGFPTARTVTVPNGIDMREFYIDPARREAIRRKWSVAEDEIVIGRVGRFDPLKDYPGFLEAASRAARLDPRLRFVCVGAGKAEDAAALRALSSKLGLDGRILWVGFMREMCDAYNAMDILASSSKRGEGFPNVILEAMACGLPCVATDVGDTRAVIGQHGIVVPHGNLGALTAALVRAAEERWSAESIRKSVADRYRSELLVSRTVAYLDRLYQGRRGSDLPEVLTVSNRSFGVSET